ncbi:uncharacterized protein LOC131322788 isoform X4 [Rhododendron vialii]|uniref:uncharacterized protein LOC131322788 isoform X4 n=1 Tax=Rhododendron vialii TaxID=182163 RepID=UPI0026602FD5|nr:uncharacterized protein LOC131322788 isoform X4 [Rhododendron vialii]
MEKLTNLLLLDLRDCGQLEFIPRGVISNLTSLEELYLPDTFDQWEATDHKRQDKSIRNVTLEELRWSLSTGQLTTLQMNVPDVMLLPKEGLNFENLKIFWISVGLYSYSANISSQRYTPYTNLPGTRVFKCERSSLPNEFIPLVDKAESLYLKDIEGLKKLLQDRGVGNNRFLDLKYLEVRSCDDYLEYLIGEPKSFDQSHGLLYPSKSFNNLIEVIVERCELKYLFSPFSTRGLVHLKKLKVKSCEIMEEIVGFEGQNDEDKLTSAVNFSKLSQLQLTDLPNLISFYAKKEKTRTTMGSSSAHAQPLFNEKVVFPVLEILTICGVGNIIEILDNHSIAVWQEQGSFCKLMEMNVDECDKLMHVYPSNMHPLLKNLEKLNVDDCGIMKGVVRFEGQLGEDGLRNDPICFHKLTNLSLSNLPNLVSFCTESGTVPGTTNDDATIHGQSIFNEKVASPALEHLEMVGAPKLTEVQDKQPLPQPRIEVESLSKLECIMIGGCNQLLYVFPSNMLPQNLQELEIENCDVLEVIVSKELKEKEAINHDIIVFPQLKSVTLRYLPKLKSFYTETQGLFSDKVAFPVLKSLSFENLDKITRIWDNQPLSELEKEAKSFYQLMDIYVLCCVHLEYILPFYMLPQLKNLQELTICGCTKMEVIISKNPKEKEATINDTILFPQLKTVKLNELPNLKSLCTETQLFFSNKDAFPVLETIKLVPKGTLEFLWNEMAPTKEVSTEECGTSGKESDHNGEQG